MRHIGGQGDGSPHTGLSLFSASRGTFLERLRTGPGIQPLLGKLRSRYLSTWGLRSAVLLGVAWLHTQTQDLQAAAGKQRYPTPGPQGCGQPPHREPLSRGSLPAALFLPFPHIPRTWTAFTENSGLGEETPEAPGRVPAGKPIHPSEDTLPTCGQNSSPRGAAVCPKQAPLLE